MPKVPSLLPQDLLQKQQPDPADMLIAAADLHSSGAFTEPARSIPTVKNTLKPEAPRSARKLKVLK